MSEAPAPPVRAGHPGAEGYHAVWAEASEDGPVAGRIAFQYGGMRHQAATAIGGMWLFLVSEALFFGGLFLLYAVYRFADSAGIAEGSRHAEPLIGTVNTLLLLTSSAVFAWGVGCAEQGRNRALFHAAAITAALGVGFLLLKGWEWQRDFDQHLFPGAGFAIVGPHRGGAARFWSFYFVATGLHGLHMVVGVGLVAWIARTARAGRYSARYFTPVEVVGLYWSFVDMVWLCLYPVIYLAGRLAS
jgi:cytochrome c oxidase subunit 3